MFYGVGMVPAPPDVVSPLIADECPHKHFDIKLMQHGPHFAKRVCGRCGLFRGFVVRPQTRQLRNDRLAKAEELCNASPTPEEYAFLLWITKVDGRMSPRQEAHLNGLWARYIVEAEITSLSGRSNSTAGVAGQTDPSPHHRP